MSIVRGKARESASVVRVETVTLSFVAIRIIYLFPDLLEEYCSGLGVFHFSRDLFWCAVG